MNAWELISEILGTPVLSIAAFHFDEFLNRIPVNNLGCSVFEVKILEDHEKRTRRKVRNDVRLFHFSSHVSPVHAVSLQEAGGVYRDDDI